MRSIHFPTADILFLGAAASGPNATASVNVTDSPPGMIPSVNTTQQREGASVANPIYANEGVAIARIRPEVKGISRSREPSAPMSKVIILYHDHHTLAENVAERFVLKQCI